MGQPPTPLHTLDRINVNGNYDPKNCRWATKSEQKRNTRVNDYYEINGVKKCLADWCDEFGRDRRNVRQRIKKLGWSIEEALRTGPLKHRRISAKA